MTSWNVQPTKAPQFFPYALPPERLMNAMRASGASDTQIVAVYRAIIRMTFETAQAGEPIIWPNIGTWHYVRYQPRRRRNPNTGAMINVPQKYRFRLRPNWRTR